MEANEYIKTGFTDFDKEIGGLRKGSLILLGARPGMGKITLARDIAHNITTEADNLNSVLFFTNDKFDEKYLFGENGKTIVMDDSSKLAETMRSEALANKARLIITSFNNQSLAFLTAMREIAAELNIPIVMLVKLPREYSKDKGPRPTLEDFKMDDNQLELADVVICLHRESYYNSNDERPLTPEIDILKNSFGKNTIIDIAFDEGESKFKDL